MLAPMGASIMLAISHLPSSQLMPAAAEHTAAEKELIKIKNCTTLIRSLMFFSLQYRAPLYRIMR